MTSLRYKVIALDFDGVLAESNDIKDRAFEYVFADFPKYIQEILDYHHRTSVIRFEKFRYIYTHILKQPYNQDVEGQLAQKFSQYCIDAVIRCPWVKGAKDFLDFFYGQIPLYLVSINPDKDLRLILKGRGIDNNFKGIYAVEGSKTEALKDIVHKEHIRPKELVFIGDALSDCESARRAGVDFIGRRSGHPFEEGQLSADNLSQIKEIIIKV